MFDKQQLRLGPWISRRTKESQKKTEDERGSSPCYSLWDRTLSLNSQYGSGRGWFAPKLFASIIICIVWQNGHLSIIQTNTWSGFESGDKWPFLSIKSSPSDRHYIFWADKFTFHYSWFFGTHIFQTLHMPTVRTPNERKCKVWETQERARKKTGASLILLLHPRGPRFSQ